MHFLKHGLLIILAFSLNTCKTGEKYPPASQESERSTLTTPEIWQNPQKYNGQVVTVEGKAMAARARYKLINGKIAGFIGSSPTCTELFCGPDNPCCNSCHTDVSMGGGDQSLNNWGTIALRGKYKGKDIGCGGDSCKLTCNPPEGSQLTVKGKLRLSSDEYKKLELDVSEIILR